jgi:hypothetical protein
MSDPDHLELKLKQTELFAARQILDELNQSNKPNLYIQQLPLSNIGDGDHNFRDFHYQRTGLQRLVDKKLIQILNPNDHLKIGISIHIVDVPTFRAFYTELFESIPSTGHGARIIYCKRTGKGKVNGNIFRLNRLGNNRSKNRKVFEYLVKHPNQYVTKNKLWVIAGEKGKFDEQSTDHVIIFNDIIKAQREALKNISPKQLRLKTTVILDAEVTLTD